MQQSFVILSAFLIACVSSASVGPGPIPETQTCMEYDSFDPTKATCNSRPDVVCSKGCTGGVVATKCTLDIPANATTPAKHDYKDSLLCTKTYGKSSAASYTCVTEDGGYDCTGPSSGNATCSGCASNGVEIGNVPATTPGANGTAPMNGTSTTANTTTPATPAAGSSGEPSGSSSESGHSTGTTSGAQAIVSSSMFSACAASVAAGVASLVF